jgi:hypothetical protein
MNDLVVLFMRKKRTAQSGVRRPGDGANPKEPSLFTAGSDVRSDRCKIAASGEDLSYLDRTPDGGNTSGASCQPGGANGVNPPPDLSAAPNLPSMPVDP